MKEKIEIFTISGYPCFKGKAHIHKTEKEREECHG